MSDDIAAKIAELEASLRISGLPAAVRELVELQIAMLRGQITQQQSGGANLGIANTIGQTGDIVAGDLTRGVVDNQGHINGVAVGINLGRIVYGRDPEEDERRRLVWYLARLAAKLNRLPLRGLDEKLDQGDGVSLPQIYVMLATADRVSVTEDSVLLEGRSRPVEHFYRDGDRRQALKEEFDPDFVLPDRAIVAVEPIAYTSRRDRRELGHRLARSLLATEAVQRHRRLVLLGEPGGGKSTFLRHLAWALARRGLDQLSDASVLFGWDDQRRRLPILLPLRTLAGRLAVQGAGAQTVYAALLAEIENYNITHVDDMLSAALHRGVALLLFDGLDEVPLDAIAGVTADRHTTLRAVRDFAQLHSNAPVILTCRVRAFDEPLRAELGWSVETILPFTLGQIRHFIPAWYRELTHCGQIEPAQAERMGRQLLDTIVASPKLRAMAENPLLLTMMALILYNKGVLPRDRPQLYERILELLLGQWDKVRDGQSLAEAIGVPDWGSERLRPLLDRLSFQAHAGARSADGRGQLARRDVREALEQFLIQAGMRDDQAAAASVRCLDYFNHRSSLLGPDDAQDSYTFAHLTLQEHCAGRALALDPDAVGLVLRHRADDRWREPILLGLGVAQQTNPALLDRVLTDLIDVEEDGRPKLVERRQRDLILAAEIGKDRDWGYLRTQRVNVDRLQRDLRRGLVVLLQDAAQPLPVVERVRAGFLLGELGDPRFPVTLDEWRQEVARAQQGDFSGYFCCVKAGTYIIGSGEDDPDAEDEEKPQHTVTFDVPFLIARYPITNAQWLAWVEQADGKLSYFADDTDLNGPNQPVVAVSWPMCNDFCAWLSAQLGMTVRLPSEKEWEAAARGGDARRYPWGGDWQDERAATGEDQETRGQRWSVPVGCYPVGAALCGVLDMAGNTWEWTASIWQSYPGAKESFTDDNRRASRGGGWDGTRNRVRCGARDGTHPDYYFIDSYGFRVVLSPPLAQTF